jgi:hypothetical protein
MKGDIIMTDQNVEKMKSIVTKYIVVSLPRTGTASICQMFNSLGLNSQHVPGSTWQAFLFNRPKTLMLADTPVYCPSVIEFVLRHPNDVKFIYLNKDPEEWFASMQKVKLSNTYVRLHNAPPEEKEKWSRSTQVDFASLHEILKYGTFEHDTVIQCFNEHKETMERLIPEDRLLKYNFSDGWKPICNLVGVSVPDIPLPHLNQNTMFDKIIRPEGGF